MTDVQQPQAAYEAERLVREHSDTILRVSYGYLGSREDAQDICHDVLLKMLMNTTTFKSADHERAYIIRATINTCKNFLTQAERRLTDSFDELPEEHLRKEESLQTDNKLELPDSDTHLGKAIIQLPPSWREAVLLYYWAGYSVTEIATQLNTSPGAISMRLNRARTLLHDVLTGVHHD